MSFSLDVAQWTKDAEEGIQATHKAIIFELFTAVILDTPVLEGRLRGNWIMSFDRPASGDIGVTLTEQSAESRDSSDSVRGKVTSATVNAVFEKLGKLNELKDFSVFLSNNLPYAHRIEYGGWSKKSPEGMVRKNIIRITNELASR